VEQQDQKLKDLEMLLRSEIDKVNNKLDVIQEPRIVSRYFKDNVRDDWL
jgi:hypothetical protein